VPTHRVFFIDVRRSQLSQDLVAARLILCTTPSGLVNEVVFGHDLSQTLEI
jgi:hypothetical protein